MPGRRLSYINGYDDLKTNRGIILAIDLQLMWHVVRQCVNATQGGAGDSMRKKEVIVLDADTSQNKTLCALLKDNTYTAVPMNSLANMDRYRRYIHRLSGA